MKNELMKESLFNDVSACMEDVRLLFRDFGFDIEECDEDESECEDKDPEIYKMYLGYKMIRSVLDDAGY